MEFGATYTRGFMLHLLGAIEFNPFISISSSNIQSALIIDSMDRAVAQFSELAELAKKLQCSQCRHLVNFVNETVMFWDEILKEKLSG